MVIRTGECNRCGRCCGDDEFGWCEWLEGRPPGPTICKHPNYPGKVRIPSELPCGHYEGWPDDPNVMLPEGCSYRWVENGYKNTLLHHD